MGGLVLAGSSLAGAFAQGAGGTVVDVTTLSVNTNVGGSNNPFTFGQAFKQGDVPSGQYVTSSLATFQSDVRNRWPDGSVKFAVLSGIGPSSTITLQRTNVAPSGTSVAEPSASSLGSNMSVVLTGVGAGTYTPQTAATNGLTAWNRTTARKVREIPGTVMSEFHYYTPTADGHLTVWWYVRVYSNGSIEVETAVENGWLQVASPASKAYTVTVNVGGSQRYTASLTHLHHTRWSRVDWVGTNPQVTPAHNVVYLRDSKMVPNFDFLSPTATAFAQFGASAANPTPFALGDWSPVMGNAGAQNPIGILPFWENIYCINADSRAYAACISNVRGHGRWPVHFRDEVTGRVPLHQSYPNMTIESGWGVSPPPSPAGGSVGPWDIPHHPSVGYLAYLIEGRWTQLEAMEFVSAYNILENNPDTRIVSGIGPGVIACVNSPMTTRGAAWTWRSTGQAAALSPKYINGATPLAADLAVGDSFRTSMENTWSWNKSRFVDGTIDGGVYRNTVGWVGHYDRYFDHSPANEWWGAGWMVSFQVASVSHIADLGIEGITQASLVAVRNHMEDGVIRLAGTESTWNFRRAGTYDMPFLKNDSDPGNPVFMTTPEAFVRYKAATGLPSISASSGDSLKDHDSDTNMTAGSTSNDANGYWSPVIANISVAIEHGRPGAQAAFDLISAASNYNPVLHLVNDDPRWGFRKRAGSSLPAHISAAPLGQWTAIGTNTLSSVAFDYTGWGVPGFSATLQSLMSAWSGGTYDANVHRLYIKGGGHNDYDGNEIYAFNLQTNAWSRLDNPSHYDEDAFSGGANNPNGWNGVFPDNGPQPVHTYEIVAVNPNTGKLYCLGKSGSASINQVQEFNPAIAAQQGIGVNKSWWAYRATVIWPDAHSGSSSWMPDEGQFLIGYQDGGTFINFRRYNPITNVVGSEIPAVAGAFTNRDTAMAYSAPRRIAAMHKGNNAWVTLNTATNTMAIQNISGPTLPLRGGLEYDTVRDTFIFYSDEAADRRQLYSINPSTWVATLIQPSSGATPSGVPGDYQGIYGRFAYCSDYDVYVAVNSVSGSVYIYRPV